MIPEAKLRFEQTDLYQNIRKSGVKVFSHLSTLGFDSPDITQKGVNTLW